MSDAIGCTARASPVDGTPSDSNEHIDPHSTPPSSPTKYTQPSTPKSTPLHRRFLQEVAMSPATPATPATPPRTPSRIRAGTPTNDRTSPTKTCPRPTKVHGSPAKLEIGQNAFYFSCEIPASKITPKKESTPQKGSRAGTPTRGTPGLLRNGTPVQRHPAKALFTTLTKVTGDAEGCSTGTLPTSTQASSSIGAKVMDDALSSPSLTACTLSADLPDNSERHVTTTLPGPSSTSTSTSTSTSIQAAPSSDEAQEAKKKYPENIGLMMARLTSGTFKTHDWTHAGNSIDPVKSPAPTPLRQASQRLHTAVPPKFLQLDANPCKSTVVEPTKNSKEPCRLEAHKPHPLEGKYFDEEKRVKTPIKSRESITCRMINPAGAKVITRSTLKNDTMIGGLSEQHSSPEKTLPEPKPKEAVLSQQSENRTQSGGSAPCPVRNEPESQYRRVGTDPEVYLAMKKDMASMGESLCRSIGSTRSSQRNTNELPTMSNVIFKHEQDSKKPKPSPALAPSARGRLTRCQSDSPAIRTVKSRTPVDARGRATTMTGTSASQWRPVCATPQAKREKKTATPKKDITTTPRSRPIGTAPNTRSVASAKTTSTSRRQAKEAGFMATPVRSRVNTLANKQTPATAPAKARVMPPTGSRSTQNPKNPTTPSSRPTPSRLAPASRAPTSTRKTVSRTQKSTAAPKTYMSEVSMPYDPSTDSRSYEEKFVNATDIADRVKQWQNEDLENTTAKADLVVLVNGLPIETHSTKIQSTAPDTIAREKMAQSTTPPGSPRKLPTSSPSKVSKDPSTRPVAKPPTSTPKKPGPIRPAPRTPASAARPTTTASKAPIPVSKTPASGLTKKPVPPHPLRTPLRNQPVPRTPAQTRIVAMDRNAFRTPSKAIESSLDRAIDEKLREDARRGKEFTPGGQKIKELLDMRRGDQD